MFSEEQHQVLEQASAEIAEKAAFAVKDWRMLSSDEQGEAVGKVLTQLGLSLGSSVVAAKVASKIAVFARELGSSSGVRQVLKAAETMADQGAKHADDVASATGLAWEAGQASNLVGKEFENYLVSKFGGRGSFKLAGREFDGAIGNRWYEAKSGKYWEKHCQPGSNGLQKFMSDIGEHAEIARKNGAVFEVHSNTSIPQHVKNWLRKRDIQFIEHLE